MVIFWRTFELEEDMARVALFAPVRSTRTRCPFCRASEDEDWEKIEILREKGLFRPNIEYRFIFHGKSEAPRLDMTFKITDWAFRNTASIVMTGEPTQWDVALLNRLSITGANEAIRLEDYHAIAPGQHVRFRHACPGLGCNEAISWDSPLILAHIAKRPLR
ncbi:MAG: hypothetical protein WC641_04365 [Patescibacteria group bacterium]